MINVHQLKIQYGNVLNSKKMGKEQLKTLDHMRPLMLLVIWGPHYVDSPVYEIETKEHGRKENSGQFVDTPGFHTTCSFHWSLVVISLCLQNNKV